MADARPGDEVTARLLAEAVRLATENVANGGGPFGALVVRGGQILGTGVNRVTVDLDPSAHAEVTAIRDACRRLRRYSLAGCELVSSCEPCPMCLATALWSRLDKVTYAADRFAAARGGFDDLAFYRLFDTPRHEWPVPVRDAHTEGASAPFDAWTAKVDRTHY
jgi:tRNA(Arg) A34 adenosine deaminase TadA